MKALGIFFRNNWVVGIGGGIISGIVVFFITKWLMQRDENKEYNIQVNRANNEVINSLKPYISNNGLPEILILESLRASIARKYKVSIKDMYTIQMYCEELIREIISNVYISSDKKREYTDDLKKYIDNLNMENSLKEYIKLESRMLKNQKTSVGSKNTIYLSSILAIMTMILSMFLMLIVEYGETLGLTFYDSEIDNAFIKLLFVPLLIILLMILVKELIDIIIRLINIYKKRKSTNKRTSHNDETVDIDGLIDEDETVDIDGLIDEDETIDIDEKK